MPTVLHAFYAAVTDGAQTMLEEHGYRLILIASGEECEAVAQAIETLVDHETDGLLVSTAPLAADRFTELLGSTKAVFIDELAPGAGVGNVALENARGVSILVDHLLEHGHRRIAFLGGPNDRTSGHERLSGYLAAMERHGLDVDQGLVRECEWTIGSGFQTASELLALPEPPEALVTASGELALGTLAAARQARVAIPQDVALCCYDDLYFAPLLEPSLTAIGYDARRIGAEAARLLLGALEDDDLEPSETRIPVGLVRRRSCGCEYDPAVDLAEAVS